MGRLIDALRVGALASILVLSAVSGAFAQVSEACAELLERRSVLESELAELMARQLPEEKLRELATTLSQVSEVVKGTASDAKELSEEKLEDLAARTQPLSPKTSGAISAIAKGLTKWTGKAKDAIAVLDTIVPELERWADRLEAAETDSAEEQILALKQWFDELRDRVPVDAIPGLGTLLTVYSESIGGIASSVRIWEWNKDRVDAIYKEVEGKPLYIRARSPREVLSDARQGGIRALSTIDVQIDEAGCDRPQPQQSLCETPHGHIDRGLEAAIAAAWPQRAAAEAKQREFDAASAGLGAMLNEMGNLEGRISDAASQIVHWKELRVDDDVVRQLIERKDGYVAALAELQARHAAAGEATVQISLDLRLARRNEHNAIEAGLGRTPWTSQDRLFLRVCLERPYVPLDQALVREANLTIDASLGWQKSGVFASAGETVQVSASGEVQYSDRTDLALGGRVGPGGVPLQLADFASNSVRGEWPHAAVIARVGDNVFHVGSRATFSPAVAGEVELRVNDTVTTDNAGTFDAVVARDGMP
jgi:hypothetical protein